MSGFEQWTQSLNRQVSPPPGTARGVAYALQPSPSPGRSSLSSSCTLPLQHQEQEQRNTASSNSGPPFRDPEDSPADEGHSWRWSDEHQDFITTKEDGSILGYKEFQLSGRTRRSGKNTKFAPSAKAVAKVAKATSAAMATRGESVPRPLRSPAGRGEVRTGGIFDRPLDDKFTIVDKPKRFFAVGRIFKTPWFEPSDYDPDYPAEVRPSPSDYTSCCPGFHGIRPRARFKFFVVVRRRLHHSLCLGITTTVKTQPTTTNEVGGKDGHARRLSSCSDSSLSSTSSTPSTATTIPTKVGTSKPTTPTPPTTIVPGRQKDYVVLYAANAGPPAADPNEKIERDPIGVIIEDGLQFISPLARLDCGRVYTVEDGLMVSKLGRVCPDHLERLNGYYKECVE